MASIWKLSFSKRFSWSLIGLSSLYLFFNLFGADFIETNLRIFTFLVGAVLVYPPIDGMWSDVLKYWNKKVDNTCRSYKDMLTKKIKPEERSRLVSHHWKNVRWTIAYFLLFFAYLTFIVSWVFGPLGLMIYFAGSIFGVSVISARYQDILKL
ncbi:MAG: hypothetical protein J7K87_03995 [Candidatus Aenigmarchaeota archaeon]|nr:hypothetical protein [Candidatus Aenigmarchaeota archaeon]